MTTESRLTLAQAAQMALDVQSASNLSGVAFSFLDAVKAVNEAAHALDQGTEWRNRHPVVQLFVDKMASLCGMQGDDCYENFSPAYAACKHYASEENQ